MNIFVAMQEGETRNDFFPPDVIKQLETLGVVKWYDASPSFTSERLVDCLADADICITGWGTPPITPEILQKAPNLKLIVHTGGSVSELVNPDVYARGIRVLSGNKIFAESVAESVVAYILCCKRDIVKYNALVRDGGWKTSGYYTEGLLERSVGLVGFGAIPRCLVPMLRPFKADICAYDPFVSDEMLNSYGVKRASLDEIFSSCNIISLHLPATENTRGVINRELLQKIQDGALLINTARGAILDEQALTDELKTGRFKAALDVFFPEPPAKDSPLRTLPNVLAMPHMAGPTVDRRKRVTEALISDIKQFIAGGDLEHEIGLEYAKSMTRRLSVSGMPEVRQ